MSGKRRALFGRQGLLGLGAVVVVPLLVQKGDGLADGTTRFVSISVLGLLLSHRHRKPLNPSKDVFNGNTSLDLSTESIQGQLLWIRGRAA